MDSAFLIGDFYGSNHTKKFFKIFVLIASEMSPYVNDFTSHFREPLK